jgi:hypothetical protein
MPMIQRCGYDFFDVYGFFQFGSPSRGVILGVVAFDFGFAYYYSFSRTSKVTSKPGFTPIASRIRLGSTTWPFDPTLLVRIINTDLLIG